MSDLGLSYRLFLCWNLEPDSVSHMLQECKRNHEMLSKRSKSRAKAQMEVVLVGPGTIVLLGLQEGETGKPRIEK